MEPLIILVQLYFYYYLSTQVPCDYPGPGGSLPSGLPSEAGAVIACWVLLA